MRIRSIDADRGELRHSAAIGLGELLAWGSRKGVGSALLLLLLVRLMQQRLGLQLHGQRLVPDVGHVPPMRMWQPAVVLVDDASAAEGGATCHVCSEWPEIRGQDRQGPRSGRVVRLGAGRRRSSPPSS